MKKWALVVTFLYGLILVVIAWPIIKTAFIPLEVTGDVIEISKSEVVKSFKMDFKVFFSWRFLAGLTILLVCQLALLIVPVEKAENRVVTKRAVIFPIVAAGLMMALLMVGLVISVSEFFTRNEELAGINLMFFGEKDFPGLTEALAQPTVQRAIGVLIFAWLAWALIFFRWSRKLEPGTLVEKQCRMMYRGSILELLIAVPTHVIARSRDYCCAGFSTFVGIVCGVSVMLISFGPGIFFLFAERWKKIHPKKV